MACGACLAGTNTEPCCGEGYGSPFGTALVYPTKAPYMQTLGLAALGYGLLRAYGKGSKDSKRMAAAGAAAAAFGAGVLWKRWEEHQAAVAEVPEPPKPWLLSGAAVAAAVAAPYLVKKSWVKHVRTSAGVVAVGAWVNFKMQANEMLEAA